MRRRTHLALLAALVAALAARGGATVTTSSSETSDATAAAAGAASVCGVLAPACTLSLSSAADPTLAGVYDVTVRAPGCAALHRARGRAAAPRRRQHRPGHDRTAARQLLRAARAQPRRPGGACALRRVCCRFGAAAARVGPHAPCFAQGCRQGRPLYTRRQSGSDPPRVLAWAGNASASASAWVVAAAVSASGASGVVLRSNAPHLLGGFQARAAWARPEWLTPEPGHAAWLTAAGAEADVAVVCAFPAPADTATALVAATAAKGCTVAERDACELVITASTDDPLVVLSGLYPLAGCVGGRPLYTRAATTITPQMHIAFLVRAGGVWAVTPSLSGAPAAVLLPNPSVWSPATPAASRPEAVSVSYSSYAHDAWVWSAWPVPGGVLNTSVAALGRLPALPSPSFTLLCSSSDYVRSPPPSAPPAAPGRAGGGDELSSPGALGGLIAALVVAAALGALAAALLVRRQRRRSGDDATSSGSGEGGDPGSPWFAALHTRADQVVLGKELGHGGYAIVYAATWRCSPVAVKVLHPSVRQASESLNAALAKEVLLMSRIRHPNVLSVFGFCLRPPMLLLELGTRGSLAALLRSDASPGLGWRERCRLAHGVACGLAFLHAPEPPIVHLDVKCENVVLDDGLCPKVSDFGLSALLLQIAPPPSAADEGSGTSRPPGDGADGGTPGGYRPLRARGVGTPLYMPPELDSREPLQMPLAVDAFCFGSAVLHALAHHGTTAQVGEFATPVYRHYHRQLTQPGGPSAAAALSAAGPASVASGGGWNVMQTLMARESMGWMPEIAPRCPPPLAAAIRKCCVVDPAARPRMDALRDEMQALMQQADSW